MSSWSDRVDDLLFEGESVEGSMDLEGPRVVVTSHRVLVFTPDTGGPNFQSVERPNVEGVDVSAAGRDDFLRGAVKAGGVGLLSLTIGSMISLDGLLAMPDMGGGTASRIGVGGIIAMLDILIVFVDNVDDGLRVVGLVLAVGALGALGLYLRSRTRQLVIEVAGDDDLTMPAPDDADEVAVRLWGALRR